ncbi:MULTISPECIES: hypothetical protein [Geobacter]|uniref:hypothetical protein n=1 Tax=Geobacter TaxID=28231 RepID=UPI00257229CD|nr:hypothetical protein [Geobacter sulfurreducens]BEH10216.1 hypothetical protein GSUET_18280 [Geobacter sulfurreducens subsp. ethanolicus]BET58198.1 hypothetical protein GEO60473_12380 [Geobacter sp. 60473]HML78189.1 hypothetical protein [Geobacter sulfurreducens]
MLDVTWAFAAQFGLWGWIGSMIGFIMRAFPAEGVFDRRAASIWGGSVVLLFALWVAGMMMA